MTFNYRAMMAIVGALNRTYDIEEARRWWRVRLAALVTALVWFRRQFRC